MSKETAAKRPTHALYTVTGEGEKAFWTKIGAGWANKDGKGFNITLTALPVNGRVVMREMTEGEEAPEAGEGA